MGCILKGNSGLYSRLTVGAVLLAAGAGTRLGGRPKPLLELGGVPLILRSLIALSGSGVDEVAIVLGHHAPEIEATVRAFPVTLVKNPAPEAGQPSSVRLGLAALSARLDALMIVLADQPLIESEDITALIGAFKKRGNASMVVPRVTRGDGSSQPGNPIIFDAALRDEWLAGSANLACRQWRATHPERISWFDTGNHRYALDIDTPEDLERFAQETGHRLLWPGEPATGARS
jgi:molybdenum cofactor cytidylyltransferase